MLTHVFKSLPHFDENMESKELLIIQNHPRVGNIWKRDEANKVMYQCVDS